MSKRMSFCLEAIKTLRDDDLDALTAGIEGYVRTGVAEGMAETLALSDLIARVAAEQAAMTALLQAQHPELFAAPAPAAAPQEQEQPAPKQAPVARPNAIVSDDAAAAARERLRKNRGRLNSGIDPQEMLDGITLAVYHIERGARKFAAFARAMVDDLGDWVKPYLKSWYMATKYGPYAASFEGMSAAQEVESADVEKLESTDAASRQPDLEPDRHPGQEPHVAPADGNGQRAAGPGDGPAGGKPGGQGGRPGGGTRLRAGGPAVPGAASDPVVLEEEPAVPGSAAGSAESERGDHADDPRAQSDRFSDPHVETTARAATAAVIERTRQQRDAETIPVETGLDNIAATLPVLLPLQQKDVKFAEDRFAVPDGYGVLFTNGTGTGKTAVALGAIKRMVKQGKKNILVVVPSAEVIKGWVRFAPMLGLTVTQLKNTKDAGSGVVITTYANMRSNDALVTRAWDMVVADEAQALNQNAEGEPTEAALRLRALTMHPNSAHTRTRMLNPELYAEMQDVGKKLDAAIKAKDNATARVLEAKLNPLFRRFSALVGATQEQIEAAQGATRTRAMFLSATPFAYEASVKWGQGYLFDWNKGFTQTDGYNAPDAYQNFMITNFGWHMKTGKLNQPDERKVNRSVMQRQFNQKLKDDGALAGRMLEVEPDYDRRFIAAQSGLGKRIDEGLQWFYDTRVEDLKGIPRPDEFSDDDKAWESRQRSAMHAVREAMGKRFDYHSRMRLLESLKAEAAVPWIKGQLAAGRKVVVFHDLIQGQTHDPFNLQFSAEKYPVEAAVFNEWKKNFDDLVTRNWNMLKSPIETLTENFPGIGLLNGEQSGKARSATLDRFNSDDQGPMVMVVQAALEAGWSGHDTTGKYPRVLLNLGLPVTPTRSIQQEGRIYRVGQASNAMFRYMNTQTNWEFTAFASTIAKRASTAENLAMGSEARGLLDSYIESFEATGDYPAGHEGEGTGGKSRDRELAAVLTEWDKAKTMYWAKLKKTAKTKAREGADWFATPEPLGMKMVEWLDLRDGETSMEPSAGDGAIARWLPDFTKRIAVEPSPTLAPRLALVFDGSLRNQKFEDLHVTNKADGVVMNPPFGKGGSLAGPHLDKAFNQHLDEGGRLVALIPEGPAMEARLDKLLTGTHEAPVRPVGTVNILDGEAEMFRDDQIETRSGRIGVVRAVEPNNVVIAKMDDTGRLEAIPGRSVDKYRETGPRTETVPNSEGAHVVATIRLPADTFGRAGTKVMTRIVIIDKLAKDQEGPARVDHDFSRLASVEELFDAIESLKIPERTKPRPAELDAEGAGESQDDGTSDIPKEKDKPAPKRDIKDTRTKEGIEIAEAFGIPVIEHTTGSGKLLQGVILKHVTTAQAKEFDKFGWPMKGGTFVRVWELNDLLKKYPLPPPAVPNLSRGGFSIGTVPAGKLRAAVTKVTMAWEEDLVAGPTVRVVDTAADLPEDILTGLRSQGAEQTTRGLMMDDGRVFLIADRLASVEDGLRVLFHETYGHVGLRYFLGDSYQIQMGLLRMANPKLAAEANAWYASFGQLNIAARIEAGMSPEEAGAVVRALAVEEALADRAMDDVAPKGWKMLMARLQKALRDLGMGSVADWLESMTEAETHALLANARYMIRGNPASVNEVSDDLAGRMRVEPVMDRGGDQPMLSRAPGIRAALAGAIKTKAAFDAVDRASVVVDDAEAYFALSQKASAARTQLADELAAQPDDGFVLQGRGFGGRLIMLNASAQQPGQWQLTRFDGKDEPLGDSQYSTKAKALEDFLREIDLASLQDMNGPVGQGAGASLPALSRAVPAAAPVLKPSSAWADTALRVVSAPVAKVTSAGYTMAVHYSDLALGAALPGNTWEYVKAGMVDQYGLDPEHNEAKTQMRTAIRVNARKTGEIVDKLRALSAAESRIAYLWMSDKSSDSAGERALFDQLPEESRLILASLKADIEYLSDEAVTLGLLSPEVRERHAMAYMHRSYEKYEAGEAGARVARTRAISILGDQFKGRGMRDNAGMDQIGTPDFWARKTRGDAHDHSLKGQKFHRLERRETPDTATPQLFEDENGRPMGRIREIAYWPAGEPIPAKFNDWRNDGQWEARFFDKGGKVGMWRDFTLAERGKLGEVQEVKYATAITMMQMVRDVETARFLDWVARNESVLDPEQFPDNAIQVEGASYNLTRSFLKNEWVQIPQTTVPGTGVHKYANLAGRWVPGPVWNDIRQISELTDQGDLMRIYSQSLRLWKISKALALDTPIPTPAGWTTMGDIKVGDKVFDEQGKVCEVLGATPVQLDRKCYRVEFSDGTSIVADAEHLWFTIRQGTPGVRNTEEILATLKERTRGDANHKIPVAGELALEDVNLPVAPYALGAWLGDGDTRAARITAGTEDAAELRGHLEAAGVRCAPSVVDKRNGVQTFQVQRGGAGCIRGHDASKSGPSGCWQCSNELRAGKQPEIVDQNIQVRLREIGVLGNKHIPAIYLRASAAQRRELLQGLMDTDGNITEKGMCSFSTSLEPLRDGMLELLRSLGYKPTASEWQPSCAGKPGKTAWRIHFKAYADKPVFKLARKNCRLAPLPANKQRSQARQIVAITPVASVPVRCIAVSSKSRLYLAGPGMVPTHNTALSPVTHMNNVMSNVMLADIHDIQARHIYTALNAWLRKGGDPALRKLIEDYQDNGGDAGKFNESEVREELFGPLLEELKRQIAAESGASASVSAMQVLDLLQHRQFRQALAAAGNSRLGDAAKWIPKKMMKLYGVEDEVFRLAAFVKAREDGLNDHDAGRFARESFLNYEITAPWVNAMRRTAWPFFAFTYRALPMLAKSFSHKPHKLLKYYLLASTLGAIAYGWTGGDEDEERALMSEEKAGRIWGFLTPKLLRMPWDDHNGSPVFLDIRRWIPAGDFADVGQSKSVIPLPPPLAPGGPLMLLASMALNSDGFTGEDIVNDGIDDWDERLGKSAGWLWKGVMPNNPVVPWTYSQDALIGAVRGDVVAGRGGQEKASLAQAALSTVGVKVGSYPIESLAHNAAAKFQAEAFRIGSDAKKAVGQIRRTGKTDEEKIAAETEVVVRAKQKIDERGEDFREKRKAAGL